MFSLFFKVVIDDIIEVIKSPNPSHLTCNVSSDDFRKVNGLSNLNGIWPW